MKKQPENILIHTAHTHSDSHKYTKTNQSSTHITPSCICESHLFWLIYKKSRKERKRAIGKNIYQGEKQHPRNMWTSTSQLSRSSSSHGVVYTFLIDRQPDR
ncbi:hypothetical protein DAPPUDRAFT_309026 [Daphnia pulex]|uniref:Uncharacterized protein n=1 Tax=Daphnia pulex TaxID=6669 RepID=E9G428_DAPPU|nr:hypothetical protein DAPPUDRAFT_309026 [Daphnia pulex]|eukprot:EFX85872.1 hypothetical protein DAPPUDRAFT_309026 [Daphnia pulex]